MKKFFLYYSFVLTSIMSLSGFFSARNTAEIVSAILFLPLPLYLLKNVIPIRRKALVLPLIEDAKFKNPKKSLQSKERNELNPQPLKLHKNLDMDRRMFVKLIGSAGISLFLLSIFTGRAHATFFGSVPGPGTVSLKDTSGQKIDPAKHHPTDGYKISQLDDSSPAFYGFTNKDGEWFILQEDDTGAYRYAKGSSNFSTNWDNRASLSYDYFHNVF